MIEDCCGSDGQCSAKGCELERLKSAISRVLTGGNHLATYSNDWPSYKLEGLTREQQCEHALISLGATKDYDMWCCWSAIMQTRDEIQDIK